MRVGGRLRDRDLDTALLRVVDLLVARQAHPDAHRRDDLEPGVEGVDGHVEADLVVALAGAAVRDRVGALLLGDLDEQLRDERPGQRRRQRVDALVQGVRLQRAARRSGRRKVSRASTTYARAAPADIARRSTPSRSEPPPTSTVSVTTSTPYCSRSQATATDVSRPPE